MDFPIFRKYNGIETYFKVKSDTSFQELKISDSFYSLNDFHVVNHFDRLFIQDIIQQHDGRWLVTDEHQYNLQLQFCENNLKRIE
jgi:hypothetical protein